MALHVSAPLAHAVDLGLLEVEVLLDGGVSYNGGDGEDTLSSYACEYDVFFHGFTAFLPLRASLRSGCTRDG